MLKSKRRLTFEFGQTTLRAGKYAEEIGSFFETDEL